MKIINSNTMKFKAAKPNCTRSTDSVKYGTFTDLNYIKGVYYIKCTENEKIYIGSSKSIGKRISKHFSECNFNRHPNNNLQTDYNLYGQSKFTFGILLETNNLLEEEYRLQMEYDKQLLYNDQIGGEYSKSHREKIAKGNSLWDRTNEYKNNLSKAKTKYSIVQLTRTGEIVNIFDNVFDILKIYPEFKTQPIRAVCNGGKKSYKEFIWRYVEKGKESEFKADFSNIKNIKLKVIAIDKNTNLITIFNSIGDG